MKQIVLHLDEERYQVLVQALTCITDKHQLSYTEKEQVLAEQIKGLVITQWTGSREIRNVNFEQGSTLTAKAIGAGAVKSNI